jgi:ABC-type sulfate transport system permease component
VVREAEFVGMKERRERTMWKGFHVFLSSLLSFSSLFLLSPLVYVLSLSSRRHQAAARPQVTVYSAENGEATSTVAMPAVFTAPIRLDLVHDVHTNMAKNR